MSTIWQSNSDGYYAVTESGMPGSGSLKVGFGSTIGEAIDNLKSTPYGAHESESKALQWALEDDGEYECHEEYELSADDMVAMTSEQAAWCVREHLFDPDTLDKDDVGSWEQASSFVATFPDDGPTGEGATDVSVEIGCAANHWWFIRTSDDAGGSDDCDDTRYPSETEAREAATGYADENHEAQTGEDAEAYLARKLDEDVGKESEDGLFALYFESACSESEGVKARYETKEQAEAAATRANKALKKKYPGSLLCGYVVRELEKTVYTYTIWDHDASSGVGGDELEEGTLEAGNLEEAKEEIHEKLELLASGLSTPDFAVGDLLHAQVCDNSTVCVIDKTYKITSEDLGIDETCEGTSEEEGAEA
jgi:hypothetical protein